MKKYLALLLCLLCVGCSAPNPLSQSDFRFQVNPAMPYMVASWHKITKTGAPLKVYIEGEGTTLATGTENNPTPQTLFLREMAAEDSSPNVVYLSRPCQYITPPNCTAKDWTGNRFSVAVINSMDTVVQSLMRKAGTNQVILIGYLDGATVAGLLATTHPTQVKKLITVAGVLDHEAWTTYQQKEPLSGSLNLKDYKNTLKQISQHHYVGEKDTLVPPHLTQQFIDDENQITVVKGATHQKGFSRIYPEIWAVQ